MKRRTVLSQALYASAAFASPPPIIIPVHRITDSRAQCTPEQFDRFWYGIWPEALRDLGRCGVQIQTTDGPGEIRRTAADRPVFVGLQPGALNLVVTDHIPMTWDRGRALAGITTMTEQLHLTVIALRYAHGHQIPYLSVNTFIHELLHALLGDIYVQRTNVAQESARELRVDSLATRVWLFHDGSDIRSAAERYVVRLGWPVSKPAP